MIFWSLRPPKKGGPPFSYPFEIWSNSENFVDKILYGLEANVAKGVLNDGIVGKWDTLTINLAKSAFVDELTDCFQVGIAPGDEGQEVGITISITQIYPP